MWRAYHGRSSASGLGDTRLSPVLTATAPTPGNVAMTTPVTVLGLDPGLANMGWALVELGEDSARALDGGVWSTQPSKRKVPVYEDVHARALVLWRDLFSRIGPEVSALCVEAYSQPRAASAAAKLARVWGMVEVSAEQSGIPLLQVPPKEVRASLRLRAGASKAAIQGAVMANVKGSGGIIGDVVKTRQEHVADAMAAAWALRAHPTIQAIRRERGRSK